MSYHNEATESAEEGTDSSYEKTFAVSVFSSSSGNKYQFDSSQIVSETLGLGKGLTYKFDQSDSTNLNHPVYFSLTANGVHSGGSVYQSVAQNIGIPGNSGAYTLVSIPLTGNDFYYYCLNHSGMGGKIRVTDYVNDSSNENFVGNSLNSTFDVIGDNSNFTVKNVSSDVWSITSELFGTDTLTNFNRLEFNDGILALDVDAGETAGQAYRLYQAAFARTPDMPGVSYHMNDMESNGLSLEQVANNFLASQEFETMYGDNPTDNQYINALYQNVLSRSPADSEVSYYQNQFDTGAMTHAAALIGFAESPENIALVSSQIDDGIWMSN